jgi:DNA helicase-2/ATP-dependent DNA helicase PcrA
MRRTDDDLGMQAMMAYEAMRQQWFVRHAHQLEGITGTLEHLIVQKDRVTLGEFIYDLLRTATDLYQRALNEETGQDLLLLNTFTRITQDYEAITRKGTLRDFLAYLDLLSGVSVEVGERGDKDAVRILTVHKSKGKEYPVVFVVDMVKDKFPLRYQTKPFFVPGDLAKGLKIGDDEKALFLQEERRLCYVAMTRAQDKLYFTLARRYGERKTDAKPSQFLFELGYPDNPLMEITAVIVEEQEDTEIPDNPVDTLKRKIRDQAHRAVEQMHLKTAIQRIFELEKVRLLEEGKSLESFDPAALFSFNRIKPSCTRAQTCPAGDDDHHFSASALKKYETACLKFVWLQNVTLPQTTSQWDGSPYGD